MKFKLSILLAVLGFSSVIAQFGPQQIVSNTVNKAYQASPFDVNADGFMDIVALSSEPSMVTWFQNLDGEGNFSDEIIINETSAWYLSYDFVDIDTDGDRDILYLVNNPRKVAWLENLDGLGNFGPEQQLLSNQTDNIESLKAIDVDDDGDLDLMAKISNIISDRLVWHENIDGMGNLGEEVILYQKVLTSSIYLPLMVDIDNDGELDLLTSYQDGPAKVVWLKNLGDGIFDDEQEIFHFNFLLSDWTSIFNIKYLDINTDGKLDIVLTSYHDDYGTSYDWLENIDNQGTFSDIKPLPEYRLFFDIDNDGDNDILSGNRFVDRIYWVENSDGLGSFTTERNITTEVNFLKAVNVADFNGDGLLDIVSASLGDDKVAWYENTGILGVSEKLENQFSLFPNPVQNKVTINSTKEIVYIELFDSLGKKLATFQNTNTLNLNNLAAGIYFVQMMTIGGTSETRKIIKQ